MIDLTQNLVIINDDIKTAQIESIFVRGSQYVVRFNNSKKDYNYNLSNVTWLRKSEAIDPLITQVYIKGRLSNDIKSIYLFEGVAKYFIKAKYYAIAFVNGHIQQYKSADIELRTSCLTEKALDIFDYFKLCADLNKLGANESCGNSGLLSSIYSRLGFIDDSTAAAIYLKPEKLPYNNLEHQNLIFPFGCNASQLRAVKTAFSTPVSVIQGPPGTGKTQTILNIISNIILLGKSVLVVSNNNSATDNVLEKLSKNGFDFLAAPLGKSENKEAFVANQPKITSDIIAWEKSDEETLSALSDATNCYQRANNIFCLQERLAQCRQELAEIEIEKNHFKIENPDVIELNMASSSIDILNMMSYSKKMVLTQSDAPIKGWQRIINFVRLFFFRRKLRRSLPELSDLTLENVSLSLGRLELTYYIRKSEELESEILLIQHKLEGQDANKLMAELSQKSMIALKAQIAKRFNTDRIIVRNAKEIIDRGQDFLKDFPIILSTTFSARNCLGSDTLFDYVIMDEASQVSVETGFLALTCAKKAVIVGDTMQLPNVITDEDRTKLDKIKNIGKIADCYDCGRHSFLSSILATLPNVPQTLLREHYRCHPDIINFCNQKFYGGNLLIMTERNENNETPLMVITTSKGIHCRGHYNQREIDTVKIEILPLLTDLDNVGIIAPYNHQVNAFLSEIPGIETATVHKYQGREKKTIILSVTDDEITEFADNANLLNVAVSRAKDKFILVVSGNEQSLKGNIHDLIGYIRYQHGAVKESKLHSIFDYLFTQITNHERQIETVSEFRSENLTFELIEKIRNEHPELSHIKALCHYPLSRLIKDLSILTDDERRYATHPSTHVDFLIINRVSKEPLLAIETDGYSFHNEQTDQYHRDQMKDKILNKYELPILRLSTVGHSEEERIVNALKD